MYLSASPLSQLAVLCDGKPSHASRTYQHRLAREIWAMLTKNEQNQLLAVLA